jgi:hypothetical protein
MSQDMTGLPASTLGLSPRFRWTLGPALEAAHTSAVLAGGSAASWSRAFEARGDEVMALAHEGEPLASGALLACARALLATAACLEDWTLPARATLLAAATLAAMIRSLEGLRRPGARPRAGAALVMRKGFARLGLLGGPSAHVLRLGSSAVPEALACHGRSVDLDMAPGPPRWRTSHPGLETAASLRCPAFSFSLAAAPEGRGAAGAVLLDFTPALPRARPFACLTLSSLHGDGERPESDEESPLLAHPDPEVPGLKNAVALSAWTPEAGGGTPVQTLHLLDPGGAGASLEVMGHPSSLPFLLLDPRTFLLNAEDPFTPQESRILHGSRRHLRMADFESSLRPFTGFTMTAARFDMQARGGVAILGRATGQPLRLASVILG